MPAHAALQYSRESFDTRVAEVMGRRVAGETLLKAWIDHADADPLTAYVHSRADAAAFEDHARELGATAPIAIAGASRPEPLRAAGTLWLADPAVATRAWERRWFGQHAWSIVGITHTISTAGAMDLIAELLTAPLEPWDALICTSRAVQRTVQTLLDEQSTYLQARLGASTFTRPDLPIIPLGVRCAALAHDPAARRRWRDELGIPPEDVAILQFGRLSFHLKAHPLPLFLALRQAAVAGSPRLHLILAGQPSNPGQGERLRTNAAYFADHFTTHFVDGARPDAGSVRSAADIFTLLSDNVQESFGLAPVEAMAAGLPVVGSDWDGLRDTIEHGVTGLLIDTIAPPAGTGEMIARRHALGLDDYHHYLGNVAQLTAIDIAQAARSFAALAGDAELRQRMGAAGLQRARRQFDWPVVIGAYRALIERLEQSRAAAHARPAPGGFAVQPARMDPFQLFAAYPTSRLGATTCLVATGADLPGGYDGGAIVRYGIPADAILDALLHEAAAPIALGDLLAKLPQEDRRNLVSGVAFLLKMGLLARC